jgi:predicted kinase
MSPEHVREDLVVPPLFVVVTGMPSSGKSTVAEGLARQLQLPVIAKDGIKESLYESLGAGDVVSSARVGVAAYGLIFALARVFLGSGVSLIAEANFFRDQEREFARLPEHRLVQLHCQAPLATLLQRFAKRSRHPGHHDAEKIKELPARFESGVHAALNLPGDLVELDTTQPVDLEALAHRIGGLE